MNDEMNPEIINELNRRYEILIQNAKPGEISTGMSGSRIRFFMALAPIGYPIGRESWMDDEYTKPIMSKEDFDNCVYDEYMDTLHAKAYETINKRKLNSPVQNSPSFFNTNQGIN